MGIFIIIDNVTTTILIFVSIISSCCGHIVWQLDSMMHTHAKNFDSVQGEIISVGAYLYSSVNAHVRTRTRCLCCRNRQRFIYLASKFKYLLTCSSGIVFILNNLYYLIVVIQYWNLITPYWHDFVTPYLFWLILYLLAILSLCRLFLTHQIFSKSRSHHLSIQDLWYKCVPVQFTTSDVKIPRISYVLNNVHNTLTSSSCTFEDIVIRVCLITVCVVVLIIVTQITLFFTVVIIGFFINIPSFFHYFSVFLPIIMLLTAHLFIFLQCKSLIKSTSWSRFSSERFTIGYITRWYGV